jgi:glutamate racemase
MAKNNERQAIGIFDSGFGGLNIMRGIVKVLPNYDFLYLATQPTFIIFDLRSDL